VRDANGQALSYIYYESEPARRSAAKLLTRHKAGRAPYGGLRVSEQKLVGKRRTAVRAVSRPHNGKKRRLAVQTVASLSISKL
jgi:hypothetical protein